MTFESQKRKINFIEKTDNQQDDQLSKQKQKNIIVDEKIDSVRANGAPFKLLRDFSTEWELMDLASEAFYTFAHKSYEIDLGYMDINLIPFIVTELIFATTQDEISLMDEEPKVLIPGDSNQPNNGNVVFYELEDHPDEPDSTIKRVTLHAGIQFGSGWAGNKGIEGELISRLIVQVRVPQEMI